MENSGTRQPGKIIILNGTSSSGKTSVLHALQNLMDEPYLEAGIDKFIFMLPSRYLDRPLWDDVLGLAASAGETGRQLVSGMHRAIRTLSLNGNNVLADHVLVESRWVRECSELFHDLPTYLVGLYCPLEVLEERECSRKNRTLGQARAQYPLVHAHGIYDLVVDTSCTSPEACAALIKQRLDDPLPPQAVRQLYVKIHDQQQSGEASHKLP